MEAPQDQITFFAKTNFRNREVPFGIKADDRRRHMYVIGKTGMGKTTMMENMAIQDIRNGHGVCFIDPHGDSVAKILNFVPNSRVNDVIYFNPADLEYPIAFNILEAVETKYKHLVASGLMGVFTKIWANMWSARMEYILNNTVLALLDSPGNTMLGITRMYVDKKYRKKIIDNIKDPMVRSFWVDEWANLNEKFRTEAVAPIQNKVGQFLSSAVIRNIVGQPKSTIDLRGIMDGNKILLMDLSKGKVGEDNSALLGAMIITKLQLAALSRVDIPEHERPDFYLYVDEFQNFATESFATILSEARKYHLNLTVGHQYIGQLTSEKNNTVLRDAIFGNVGSMVCFRVGAADAEYLETEFAPTYVPTDLVNLPKYNILLKLMINGVSSEPFSAVTMPANPDFYAGNGEKVIKVSRERYANPVAQVEEKISRWMGAEFHEQSAVILGASADSEGDVLAEPEKQESLPQPALMLESQPVAEQPALQAMSEPQSEDEAIPEITQETRQEVSETVTAKAEGSTPELVVEPQEPKQQSITRQPEPQRQNRQDFGGRNKFRPNRGPRPDFRHNKPQRQRQGSNSGNRPNHKPAKRDNPIWDMVANLDKQKTDRNVQTVTRAVSGQGPKPQPATQSSEPPITPTSQPDKKIVMPGQSVKFN